MRRRREGAAVVETAVTLPLLVLLVMGGIDVGRAIHVQHTLVTAARSGCRCYSLPKEMTKSDAAAAVAVVMDDDRIGGYQVGYEPSLSSNIRHQQPVTVSVSIPFETVSWTPSWFLPGRTLTGTCTMPGDTSEVEEGA